MRYRSGLAFAVFIVAACSVGVDGPVAVETPDVAPAFSRDGIKPPPPIGSGDTEIEIFSPSSETPEEIGIDGGPSASAFDNQPFSASVTGRYFANGPGNNGWISFESDECVVASPDAKLQYNGHNGKTHGHGTLTLLPGCGGVVVLDLSKIEITGGGFGNCELNIYSNKYECDSFQFSYNGVPGGNVNVGGFESE